MAFLSLACQRENVASSEFIKLPDNGWHADSSLVFAFEHFEEPQTFELVVHLRHDQSYPFSNLYLFRQVKREGIRVFSDTVEVSMADVYGEWNGKGVGSIKQLDIPYRKQYLRIDGQGLYTFEFQHGMRETQLKGLKSIGLTFIRRDGQNSKEDEE